jgi:hypothetical protein
MDPEDYAESVLAAWNDHDGDQEAAQAAVRGFLAANPPIEADSTALAEAFVGQSCHILPKAIDSHTLDLADVPVGFLDFMMTCLTGQPLFDAFHSEGWHWGIGNADWIPGNHGDDDDDNDIHDDDDDDDDKGDGDSKLPSCTDLALQAQRSCQLRRVRPRTTRPKPPTTPPRVLITLPRVATIRRPLPTIRQRPLRLRKEIPAPQNRLLPLPRPSPVPPSPPASSPLSRVGLIGRPRTSFQLSHRYRRSMGVLLRSRGVLAIVFRARHGQPPRPEPRLEQPLPLALVLLPALQQGAQGPATQAMEQALMGSI